MISFGGEGRNLFLVVIYYVAVHGLKPEIANEKFV